MDAKQCQNQRACALPVYLASSSRYRRELLSRLGLSFEVDSPDIDESRLPAETADTLVRRLAEAKAREVAKRTGVASLIIGSDQVSVLDGEILGKPGNFTNNIKQLQAASGRRVQFLTGLCLLNAASGARQVDVIEFAVQFRRLSSDQVEHYVRSEKPYDCAGGFKSEGLGIALFESMHGDDPSALVGLPLIRLTDMLRNEGIDILQRRRTD